jgi:hypothetical protein
MVSFTYEYIQHLKESYIGKPEYMCKNCNSIFWFSERNQEDSRKNKQIIVTPRVSKPHDYANHMFMRL